MSMKRNRLLLGMLAQNPNVSDAEMEAACQAQGVPSSFRDYRWARNKFSKEGNALSLFPSSNPAPLAPVVEETDEERQARISERFDLFYKVLGHVEAERFNSVVVYGSAGIGKSYTCEEALPRAVTIRGAVSAVGLFEILFLNRDDIIIFDDCDTMLWDPQAVNLLKAVLDTTGTRRVRWGKQNKVLEENGVELDFEFRGQVIFLTNIDLRAEVAKGNKIAAHMNAMLDRSFYVELSTDDPRDVFCRARQLSEQSAWDYTDEVITEVIDYAMANADAWHYVSLRLIAQIADIRMADKENWKRLALMLKAKA